MNTAGRGPFLNVLALGFLVVALLSFVAFHFLPGFETEAGWSVWREVRDMVMDPGTLMNGGQLVILSSFLMLTALIAVSPFLMVVFRSSRLAWWLATLMSGLAAFAFLIRLLELNDPARMGVGGLCLVSAPVFHLCGMLMIRGNRREEQAIAPDR